MGKTEDLARLLEKVASIKATARKSNIPLVKFSPGFERKPDTDYSLAMISKVFPGHWNGEASSGQTGWISLWANLLAKWDMTEEAGSVLNDQAGNNNGTITNCTFLESMLYFPGSNSFVFVSDSATFSGNLNTFSWTMRIKPSTIGNKGLVYYVLNVSNRWRLFIGSDGSLRGRVTVGGVHTYGITPAGVIVAGNWHHIAWTWTNTPAAAMQIYVDGISQTLTSAILVMGGIVGLHVGAYEGTADFYDGYMDDLGFYNVVLAQAEITKQVQGNYWYSPGVLM